jgi:oligo-1,6-glucosidase
VLSGRGWAWWARFASIDEFHDVESRNHYAEAVGAGADPDSVLHHYRRLIELRHTEPTVVHGDFHMLLADHGQVYAFIRRHGDTELLVLGNFSGASVTVEVPDAAGWVGAELVLTNVPAADALQAQLILGPWESRVHRRRRTA